jgi:hypothetical protein
MLFRDFGAGFGRRQRHREVEHVRSDTLPAVVRPGKVVGPANAFSCEKPPTRGAVAVTTLPG